MFQRFWETAKSHPWAIAGSVVGVIILFWLFTRSSSSSSSGDQTASGVYAMQQDPNVVAANAAQGIAQNQNNTQLAIAQLQADAAAKITDANNGAAISLATIQAATQTSVASDTMATQLGVSQDQLQAIQDNNRTSVSINATNDATALATAQLATSEALAVHTQDNALKTLRTSINGWLSYNAQNQGSGAMGYDILDTAALEKLTHVPIVSYSPSAINAAAAANDLSAATSKIAQMTAWNNFTNPTAAVVSVDPLTSPTS